MKKMSTFKPITDKQIAEWRKLTDERIEEILNSPNMEIPKDAIVYYVSNNGDDNNDGLSPETPLATLSAVNALAFEGKAYVCFERGGLWRGQLNARRGVTYTAYGKGDKPKIYASPFDGADPSIWTKTETENIWSIQFDKRDIGTLVFNHGEKHAIKCVIRTEEDGSTYNNTTGKPFKTYTDLCDDLHFFHDYYDTGILYLYSIENPGERFDSIEFNIKDRIITTGGGTTIDNLCLKYGGAHGVGAGTAKDLTVQNCEFGWIGGSIQSEAIFGRNYGTRYGNAVEIYGGCDNFTVTDNYIYQIYDAGITQQVGVGKEEIKNQKNMTYARNVIEYCNYSIEYFLSGQAGHGNPSRMENFLIEDNYMWYAGVGFCEQRPDRGEAAHIKTWYGLPGERNRATNYVIKDNLMLYAMDNLVHIFSNLYNPDGSDSMPTLENNNFLAKHGDAFGMLAQNDNSVKAYDESILDYIGDMTNGDTFWIYESDVDFK
ncbi:MAG: hypothetical protein IJD45_05665 [Clostridia bacterium]|nr:hypothetical protein [Clostridia bacterium]